MRRYLVVANRTLCGEHLLEEIRRRVADGECSFHLVVPAAHDSGGAWTEGGARAAAGARLDTAVETMRELGADVDGEVGDANPMLAIRDALIDKEFDEIILSTMPPGPSRWLKQDLPHRVERTFELPVRHVVAEPVSAG